MALRVALSCVVFLLSLISFAPMTTCQQCQYSVFFRTGNLPGAGTDSFISLTLLNSSGGNFTVKNLQDDWGLMGEGHDYFQRGHDDHFGRWSTCLDVCAITVTSDGTGDGAAWLLEHVTVMITGSINKHVEFPVYQWLARNEPPYKLQAHVDLCSHV